MRKIRFHLILMFFFLASGVGVGYLWHTVEAHVSVEEMRQALAGCENISKELRVPCLRRSLKTIIRKGNIDSVMQAIEIYTYPTRTNPDFERAPECHPEAHVAGEIAAGIPGESVTDIMVRCGDRCGYGCTHGAVMGVIRHNPSVVERINVLCEQVVDSLQPRQDNIACNHAVGHGLAEYAGYDIPRALVYCDVFKTRNKIDECWTGVYMEVYSPADEQHEPFRLPSDLYQICEDMTGYKKFFCMRAMIGIYFQKTHDLTLSLKRCGLLPNDESNKCVFTLGAEIYFLEKEQPRAIVEICHKTGQFASSCLAGAVKSALNLHADGIAGLKICEAADVSLRGACLDEVKTKQELMKKDVP